MKHGQGEYLLVNGDRYKGQWVHGKREGHGYYQWNNGDSCEGQWSNDKMIGIHTIIDGKTSRRQEREFRNDQLIWDILI